MRRILDPMLEVLLSDRILRARDPTSDQLVYRQVFDQAQVNYVLAVLLDLIRLERVGKGTADHPVSVSKAPVFFSFSDQSCR